MPKTLLSRLHLRVLALLALSLSACALLPSRMNAGLTPAGRLGSCAAAHQPILPWALAHTTFNPGA